MKNIININFILFLLFSALLVSCEKEDNGTNDSTLVVSTGVVGTINLTSPLAVTQTVKEAEQAKFNFTITLNTPQSKDIYVRVMQSGGDANEDDFKFSNVVIIPAYATSGKGTIEILNDNEDENTETFTLKIGDNSTANSTVATRSITFNITDCFSNLAGTYTYVTTNCYAPGTPPTNAAGPFTGNVTLAQTSSGVYSLTDASFGGWLGLYGPQTPVANNTANGVTIKDLCGTLSFGDKDQYNDTYTFSNLVISGANMSFKWTNTYGEYGSTTLTRNDGSNWPMLTL